MVKSKPKDLLQWDENINKIMEYEINNADFKAIKIYHKSENYNKAKELISKTLIKLQINFNEDDYENNYHKVIEILLKSWNWVDYEESNYSQEMKMLLKIKIKEFLDRFQDKWKIDINTSLKLIRLKLWE